MTSTQTIISTASTPVAVTSLMARPPWFIGLSTELASVAPRGRVRMKAAQNSAVREVWVVPYLRAEGGVGGTGSGTMGWPLPATKLKQRKVLGKGWVVAE